MNIIENIEAKIPTINATAKPLIGPEPNENKNKATNKVVIFESNIVKKTLLNELDMAKE